MATASQHSKQYRAFLGKLRAARSESGLTQVQVAKSLRKPQSWVSKSESGERRLDPVELCELARLYDKDVRFFLPSFPR